MTEGKMSWSMSLLCIACTLKNIRIEWSFFLPTLKNVHFDGVGIGTKMKNQKNGTGSTNTAVSRTMKATESSMSSTESNGILECTHVEISDAQWMWSMFNLVTGHILHSIRTNHAEYFLNVTRSTIYKQRALAAVIISILPWNIQCQFCSKESGIRIRVRVSFTRQAILCESWSKVARGISLKLRNTICISRDVNVLYRHNKTRLCTHLAGQLKLYISVQKQNHSRMRAS